MFAAKPRLPFFVFTGAAGAQSRHVLILGPMRTFQPGLQSGPWRPSRKQAREQDHTHTSRSVPSFSPAQHDALAAAQSRLESGSMSSQLQLAPHLRLMTSLACTVEQHAGVASNLANTPPGIESLGPGVWCRCDKEPATRGFVALCMQIGHTELVQRILTARLKVERLLLQEFVIYGAFRHGEALCCHVTLVSSLRTDGRLQPMSRGSANNGATRSCAQAHNAWWCWLRKSDAVGGRRATLSATAISAMRHESLPRPSTAAPSGLQSLHSSTHSPALSPPGCSLFALSPQSLPSTQLSSGSCFSVACGSRCHLLLHDAAVGAPGPVFSGHGVDSSNVQLPGSAVRLVPLSPHTSWCET